VFGSAATSVRGNVSIAWALLPAIVLAGAFVRFDGITFGFPFRHHPDETGAEMTVSACSQGKDFEHRYRHPPLLVNVACVVDRALMPQLSGIAGSHLHSLLSLRLVSAVAGSATVALVYLLALRFVAPPAALGAAFLFACFPAAVATAKYGTPDSLLTMLVVLALWLQMRITERGDATAYFLAALATTLAVSAKYNGAFLAGSFLVAHVLAVRRQSRPLLDGRAALTTVAAIALGLALGFPQVLFSGEAALLGGGMLDEQRHLTSAGHFGFSLGLADGYFLFHFRHSIAPAAGPVLLAAMGAGLVTMAWTRSPAVAVLLAFAVPYYAAIELIYKVPPSYERYALPLVGIYAIAAAVAVEQIVARLVASPDSQQGSRSSRAVWRMPALAALFLLAGWASMSRTGSLLASIDEDTRKTMGKWIEAHRKEGPQGPGLRGTLYAQWPMLTVYYPNPMEQGWLQPLDPGGKSHLPETAYVVASSLVYDRYLDFPREQPKWTRFYEKLFREGTLVHVEDAGPGRYMFHNPTIRLYRIDGDAFGQLAPGS